MTEMSAEELKQDEQNIQSDGSTDEKKTDDSKSEEDASKQTTEESEAVDYKAELDEEKKRLARAEKLIIDLKAKVKEKKEDDEIVADDLDEKVDALIEQKLSSKMSAFQVSSQKALYDGAVDEMTSNKDEAELIHFHLENSIKPTGNVKEDVKKAKLLANAKKVYATVKELGEALKSKATASSVEGSGHSKKTSESDWQRLTDAEKSVLLKYGADPKKFKLS